MPMRIQIEHRTRHRYDRPVSFGDHALYLRPRDGHLQRVRSFEVRTVPDSRQRWVRDVHGNTVLVVGFGLAESDLLEFDARIEVESEDHNPFDFILEPRAASFPFSYDAYERSALVPFLAGRGTAGELAVLDWFYAAVPEPNASDDVVRFLSDLNAALRRDIRYQRRDDPGIQEPDTTLSLRSGSCRDLAVLFISCCRQLGLAARFVSGYLHARPAAGGGESDNRAAGSMHAWAEVYLPGAGWKGFDPTNGILADGFFVPSAVTHDPAGVDPIQGKFFSRVPAGSVMEVELVTREAP